MLCKCDRGKDSAMSRRHRNSRILLATLVCALTAVLPATHAAAQDGPVRQRIRAWLAERRAQPAPQDGDQRFQILHSGVQRAYIVHVPPGYRPGARLPVVLALHGGGGNMDHMARDDVYGLRAKADQAGFIIVFANGVSRFRSGLLATWNAGRCCGAARDNKADDVGFLRAVVDRVGGDFSIDRRRVFAIGMSNGGMMAYRLACDAADVFAGIMSVAGTDSTTTCAPSRPVPVLHIHARDDDHVLFAGGAGKTFRDPSQVTDFTPVPEAIGRWIRLDRAAPAGQKVLSNAGVTCEFHPALPGGAPVELCVTATGGHSWPGGAKTFSGATPSRAIRANDVMWDFFSRL